MAGRRVTSAQVEYLECIWSFARSALTPRFPAGRLKTATSCRLHSLSLSPSAQDFGSYCSIPHVHKPGSKYAWYELM